MSETTVEAATEQATATDETTETKAVGRSSYRLTPESPGELATLEAEWLGKVKGIEVTPKQVRAVLMYHGEFQRSPERIDQRHAAEQARRDARAKRGAEAAERRAKAAAEAEKAPEKTAETPASETSDAPAESAPAPKKTSALKNRAGSKKSSVAASADL